MEILKVTEVPLTVAVTHQEASEFTFATRVPRTPENVTLLFPPAAPMLTEVVLTVSLGVGVGVFVGALVGVGVGVAAAL